MRDGLIDNLGDNSPGDGLRKVVATTVADLLTLQVMSENHFQSRFNDGNLNGEIFGGQYLGQSLWAAMVTADGFVPQTLTGYFLRAADSCLPLDFAVERTRQGRRFARRRVTVMQSGKEVFRAEVALLVPDARHPHHQQPMPSVPPPDGLKTLRELAVDNQAFLGKEAFDRIRKKNSFDVAPLDPEVGMGRMGDKPAMRCWTRLSPSEKLGVRFQYAELAYLSDNMANMASRVMYVDNGYDSSLSSLTLNHSLWFHAAPHVDQWLLFDLASPYAGAGVGSNLAHVYGEDGTLYASFVQDAMIRWPD